MWAEADLEADKYFLKLIKKGRLKVYKSGKVQNLLTGNFIGVKPLAKAGGYHRVSWSMDGPKQSIYLHRLVWIAFRGLIAVGIQVNHKDGNRSNNRLSNLNLKTNAGNTKDGYKRNGNPLRSGVNHTLAKLTENQVRFIRRNGNKVTNDNLARKFNVSKKAINNVIHGRSYKNVA